MSGIQKEETAKQPRSAAHLGAPERLYRGVTGVDESSSKRAKRGTTASPYSCTLPACPVCSCVCEA